MIELIYGAKGTGKTKKIIDCANDKAESVKGEVVFLTPTSRYRSEIKSNIRFIDTAICGVNNRDVLLGFIKGLLAGNYDIQYVYIDGLNRMMGVEVDSEVMSEMTLAIDNLSADVTFVLTVSCDKLPSFLAKYAK